METMKQMMEETWCRPAKYRGACYSMVGMLRRLEALDEPWFTLEGLEEPPLTADDGPLFTPLYIEDGTYELSSYEFAIYFVDAARAAKRRRVGVPPLNPGVKPWCDLAWYEAFGRIELPRGELAVPAGELLWRIDFFFSNAYIRGEIERVYERDGLALRFSPETSTSSSTERFRAVGKGLRMLYDNLVFRKTHQEGDLIELRATAFSGCAFAVQEFYVSGKSLSRIPAAAGYMGDCSRERRILVGHGELDFKPAFFATALPADARGRARIEVDMEAGDGMCAQPRCCFCVKSELGLVERMGRGLRALEGGEPGGACSMRCLRWGL